MTVSEQYGGLSTADVNQLKAAGESNDFQNGSSRSHWDIIRTNLLSTYNIILFVISAVLAILGRYNDAFITVIVGVFNALISIYQEGRAKRQLDAIAVVASPKVTVQRNGRSLEIEPAGLVHGDLIWLSSGEQAVVDGRIVAQGVVEMDESLLTGESNLIRKQQGDEILSGSFCVTGKALYAAEKVGQESYANKLTAEAKAFEAISTPLQKNVAYVVNLIILLAAIMAAIFYLTGFIQEFTFLTNVKATAVLVGLVPYGLFLTISANISANELPPGAVARLEEFTGVTYDMTADFELVASTLIAQTALSAFLTLVAILFVLFLEPPNGFFTGWRDVSSDRRPLWLVILLSVLFLITLSIKPATDYFGMLPLPPEGYVALIAVSLFWLLGFRFILRQGFLDRLLIPPD